MSSGYRPAYATDRHVMLFPRHLPNMKTLIQRVEIVQRATTLTVRTYPLSNIRGISCNIGSPRLVARIG